MSPCDCLPYSPATGIHGGGHRHQGVSAVVKTITSICMGLTVLRGLHELASVTPLLTGVTEICVKSHGEIKKLLNPGQPT